MTTELYDPNCLPTDCEYAAPAGAHLTYRGGPLLKSAKLFGVFVDAGNGYPGLSTGGSLVTGDSTASNNVTGAQLSAFLNFLIGSDVIAGLAEYNVGLGSYIGSAKINLTPGTPPPPPPPPPPPTSCDDLLNAWLSCMGYATPIKKKGHRRGGSLDLPHRKLLAGDGVKNTHAAQMLEGKILPCAPPPPVFEKQSSFPF